MTNRDYLDTISAVRKLCGNGKHRLNARQIRTLRALKKDALEGLSAMYKIKHGH